MSFGRSDQQGVSITRATLTISSSTARTWSSVASMPLIVCFRRT